MIPKRPVLLVLCAGSLLLPAPGPALGQAVPGLRGVVLDREKGGPPIVGATVTVGNPSTGLSRGIVTDARGEFRIVPLPPGRGYTVTVSFPGMATVVISDVEVAVSGMTDIPVILRPGSEVQEQVRVVGRPDMVHPEQTTTQTNFSAEFLDGLPILGRNYQDVLAMAPGVSDTDGDGNPNIHGARDTDVITLVDGVSTVDPYTGKRGQELNIESIQEIEVKTSGASAEFSRGQGGFVTILTKSGGNEFEGSFKFYWRSNLMDGDGAGLDDPTLHGGLSELGLRDLRFNDFVPFLSLSGPIRKDRAWYFFTAEYIQIQTPVNALTQAFVRTQKEKRIFGKATWDLATNHKLSFSATLDPQQFLNEGLDSFTALESGYTQELGGLNLVLKETSIFSPNLFLETTVQHLTSRPKEIPTLDADTNRNGTLYVDRNRNGFLDATERDPGQDFDRDGENPGSIAAWDVFEDFLRRNESLDAGEDLDGDGRVTPKGGCEGETREDLDCDGRLDLFDEDTLVANGRLDPGEDRDGDGFLDRGTEDRNHNQTLDDRPFPQPDDQMFQYAAGSAGQVPLFPLPPYYPYDRLRPLQRDRDFEADQATLRVSGPFFRTLARESGRVTLRQDLSLFVPDWIGQHDLKVGAILERERFSQATRLRPIMLPHSTPPTASDKTSFLGVILPAEGQVFNQATNSTLGAYFNDTFKPLPNLTINFGVRLDRESTDSFGYTPFDPVRERELFDRLNALAGGEIGKNDQLLGNNDGVSSHGYCSDPLFNSDTIRGYTPCKNPPDAVPLLGEMEELKRIALSRMTQHHIGTTLAALSLETLFPQAVTTDPVTGEHIIDRELLRTQGAATFQSQEPFRLTNNNLAPRLAISWDPFGDSKTKVFANWGRFFDKLFLQTVTPEEGPDTITRYYKSDADGINNFGQPDNGVGAAISKAPPSATQVDRGLQTPFTDELTIGFERELSPEVSFKMTYIRRRFRQQLQDKDINHSLRCCETDGRPLDQIGRLLLGEKDTQARISDSRPDLYIHNFFFNQVFQVGNFNQAHYSGLELQVVKRLNRKWQLESSYTYSRAVGDAESFDSELGDDPSSVEDEFGYLAYDQRHQVKFNAVTYLPGDWQLGASLTWASGLPFSVISTFLSLDSVDYPQFRTLYGEIERIPPEEDVAHQGWRFVRERRNLRRNPDAYEINVEAKKAFVIGRMSSKLLLTVENLLNTDDLTIFTYQPSQPNRGGELQLDAERRFGRRFEVGFQFEF
jgi:hypothetical protein